MRLLALIFFLLFPYLGHAQPVAVRSGDHNGFSRLVLYFGAGIDWSLGRTEGGYAFRLARKGVKYDLSQVYKLITHDRLAAIWVDPATENLQLGIGCICHALPFELWPGVVVIDLRDGPPPEGSSFEVALEDKSPPQDFLRGKPRVTIPPSDMPLAYDWRSLAMADESPGSRSFPRVFLPEAKADLSPLRDALMMQLSDGATRGVVQMTVPSRRDDAPNDQDAPEADFPAQVRIGEDVGFISGLANREPEAMTAAGAACLPDSRLDVAAWGEDRAVAGQMATALTGLFGEFDRLDAESAQRATRFYLYLGFGAEARQLLYSLDVVTDDLLIWKAMTEILDNDTVLKNPFKGMMACDSGAALWAVLAAPQNISGETPNTDAVVRSFSALPLHLRRHLGPLLADRFLTWGDADTARTVIAAILRAPGDPGQATRLIEAELDLALGETAAAEKRLEMLSGESGPSAAEALIALIDSRIAQGRPVETDTVVAISALAHEHQGTDLEAELLRAKATALAASGDFDAAWRMVDIAPDGEPDFWKILADKGPDTALLAHAVLSQSAELSNAQPDTRRLLAMRLLGLGFPDPALRWLSDVISFAGQATPEDRLLAARVQMQRHDAQAALRLLAGLDTDEATNLRAQAQGELGNVSQAAELFAAMGENDSEQRFARRAREWNRVSSKADGTWREAARLVSPSPGLSIIDEIAPTAPLPGALEHSRQLLVESANARATLNTLLSQRQAPTVETP